MPDATKREPTVLELRAEQTAADCEHLAGACRRIAKGDAQQDDVLTMATMACDLLGLATELANEQDARGMAIALGALRDGCLLFVR